MQQRPEEHKYINEQIINHQRLLFQIFTFSVIAAVAILGWGIQTLSNNGTGSSELAPFILLAPMAIILPCAFLISAIREEVFGWGAYIIVFHESKEDPGYETVLDKTRDEVGRFRESYTSIMYTYILLTVFCCLLFVFVISRSSMCIGFSALVLVPFSILGWWCYVYFNIPSQKKRADRKHRWCQTKAELLKQQRKNV